MHLIPTQLCWPSGIDNFKDVLNFNWQFPVTESEVNAWCKAATHSIRHSRLKLALEMCAKVCCTLLFGSGCLYHAQVPCGNSDSLPTLHQQPLDTDILISSHTPIPSLQGWRSSEAYSSIPCDANLRFVLADIDVFLTGRHLCLRACRWWRKRWQDCIQEATRTLFELDLVDAPRAKQFCLVEVSVIKGRSRDTIVTISMLFVQWRRSFWDTLCVEYFVYGDWSYVYM